MTRLMSWLAFQNGAQRFEGLLMRITGFGLKLT